MASSKGVGVSKDEVERYYQNPINEKGSNENFGTIRRSLRNINPFKTRLFRLPATPRLSRTKKGNTCDYNI